MPLRHGHACRSVRSLVHVVPRRVFEQTALHCRCFDSEVILFIDKYSSIRTSKSSTTLHIAMARSTLLMCLLYALSLCFCFGSSISSIVVNTTYGPVNGYVSSLVTNKTVITYLGIPFAKAERFENPVPPNKWSSVLQANKIDKICPQPVLPPSKVPLMSEDCLQLNVYVPENTTSSSAFAVMLWIHGGGYVIGDGTIYDGSLLATEGTEGNVIVVTFHYRLGVFGFLSSNSDDLKGNYGMMDQIAAMKWVNKNIAR